MTEGKRLSIVVAFLFLYGLGNFLTVGAFIVPLPFLEILFLILSVSFAIDRWKFHHFESILMLFCAGCLTFSKTYNYQFFLSDQMLMRLDQGIFTDLMYIGFSIAMVLLFLFTLFIQDEHKKWLPLSLTGLFVLGVVLNIDVLHWPMYGYAIWTLSRQKEMFVRGNSFWIYPLLFEVLWFVQLQFMSITI